jgi:hypothetical protein
MQTSALALRLSRVFASQSPADGADAKWGGIHNGARVGFSGRAGARRLVCGVFLLALAVLGPRSAPAQLAAKRLDGPTIRAALAGHTIDFPFPSWSAERVSDP